MLCRDKLKFLEQQPGIPDANNLEFIFATTDMILEITLPKDVCA